MPDNGLVNERRRDDTEAGPARKYVQDFEDLIEDAWSAESSVEFMRNVADEMSSHV